MRFLALVRWEVATAFRSLLAWAVVAIFVSLSGFFFYTNLVAFVLLGGFDLVRGFWVYQWNDVRLLVLVLAPLLTMRVLAGGRRQGTLELLHAAPVGTATVVLAKYVGVLVVFAVMLLATIVQPLALARLYPVDPGVVAAGLLGLFLLGGAALAIGLLASALAESQVVAAASSFAVLLFLWALTWNEAIAGEGLVAAASEVSLYDRFAGFARGEVDLGDVAFFVAVAGVALFGARLGLEARRRRGLA